MRQQQLPKAMPGDGDARQARRRSQTTPLQEPEVRAGLHFGKRAFWLESSNGWTTRAELSHKYSQSERLKLRHAFDQPRGIKPQKTRRGHSRAGGSGCARFFEVWSAAALGCVFNMWRVSKVKNLI